MRDTSAMLAEVLHMLDYALLVVDEEARIGFKNRKAERVLERSPSLREDDRGYLSAIPRALSLQIRKAIQGACVHSRVAGLRIADASAPFWLGLIFTPLLTSRAGAPCNAAVWIVDTTAPGAGNERLLCTLFGLSPAEARLALGLVAGHTLETYSRQAGVGIATVRSQLHSIFAKTDTRRQAALVALLSKLPALKFPLP